MTAPAIAPTGTTFGEIDEPANWKILDTLSGDWVTTPLRNVGASPVRDAVALFDAALRASESLVLFASRPAVCTVEVITDREISFDWLIKTAIVDTDTTGASTPETASDPIDLDDEAGESLLQQPAVSVIERLVRMLGMPKRDVLRAAGISKSTFHTWDKPDGPRPRVGSQGKLWAFAEAVEDLGELLGALDRVGPWLLGNNDRKALLRSGEFDRLLELAAPPAAGDPRPYLANLYAAGPEKLEPRRSDASRPRARVVDADDAFQRVPRTKGSS